MSLWDLAREGSTGLHKMIAVTEEMSSTAALLWLTMMGIWNANPQPVPPTTWNPIHFPIFVSRSKV